MDGNAADFACQGISLGKRVPFAVMGGTRANDIWGWVDPMTGSEYALVGLNVGTAFVDVTEPANPLYLGRLPSATVSSNWRDIKVYQDHAFIVADDAADHGMQVFDLTRLRELVGDRIFNDDLRYIDFGSAHNLVINESTGFAYAVGTNTCGGGLHMIDITTPINPLFAGCFSANYTHDSQCVSYGGPDIDHAGKEICFSSNENQIEIVDVTVKGSATSIASATYPLVSYTHQGWLTEDQRYFFLGDELDEVLFGDRTRTHVFDLVDLDAPAYLYTHTGNTTATDHNMYVSGNLLYQANYTAGLRVLEFGDISSEGSIQEKLYFDTFPANNAVGFGGGAWSVYPYLPSGTIIVSDIVNGLFVLTVD